MYKETIKKIEPEIEKSYIFLEKELQKLRTSRTSPTIVEDIIVDCFGSKLPLKQLAAISCPQPRQLVIQPWDKSYIEPIQSAITNSGLSVSPVVDKDLIRLSFPALSEDYRKTLLKVLSEKQEEVRKTVRRLRDEAWDEIQIKTKEGEIREDDKFKAKDELQKIVESFHKRTEDLGEKKKKEIME